MPGLAITMLCCMASGFSIVISTVCPGFTVNSLRSNFIASLIVFINIFLTSTAGFSAARAPQATNSLDNDSFAVLLREVKNSLLAGATLTFLSWKFHPDSIDLITKLSKSALAAFDFLMNEMSESAGDTEA